MLLIIQYMYKVLNGLYCAGVLLRKYHSLTHSLSCLKICMCTLMLHSQFQCDASNEVSIWDHRCFIILCYMIVLCVWSSSVL